MIFQIHNPQRAHMKIHLHLQEKYKQIFLANQNHYITFHSKFVRQKLIKVHILQHKDQSNLNSSPQSIHKNNLLKIKSIALMPNLSKICKIDLSDSHRVHPQTNNILNDLYSKMLGSHWNRMAKHIFTIRDPSIFNLVNRLEINQQGYD